MNYYYHYYYYYYYYYYYMKMYTSIEKERVINIFLFAPKRKILKMYTREKPKINAYTNRQILLAPHPEKN